jgi:tetratricopeptide (TPR) repeat protein
VVLRYLIVLKEIVCLMKNFKFFNIPRSFINQALPLNSWINSLLLLFAIALLISCNKPNSSVERIIPEKETDKINTDSVFHILTNYYNENPDSAILMSLEIETRYLQDDNKTGLLRLYGFLSEFYQYKHKDDYKALNYIVKALDLYVSCPELNFDDTYLYINAGNILFRYAMINEAISVYREISKIADLQDKYDVKILVSNNIGLAYQALEMCDSARYYFYLARTQIKPGEKRTGLYQIQSLNYLSSLALSCGNIDSIPIFFDQVINYYKSIDFALKTRQGHFSEKFWQDIKPDYYLNKIRAYDKIAEYSIIVLEYDMALKYYYQALENSNILGDRSWHIKILKGLSEVYAYQNNYNQSMAYIDTAINILYTESNYGELSKLFLQKSLINKQFGNYELEIKYQQYANAFLDSLKSLTLSEELISKRIELALKPVQIAMKNIEIKKNERLKTMEMQLQVVEYERKMSKYRLYSFIGLLISILVISLFLLYRHKSQRKLAEMSLVAAEKEKKFVNTELQNFSMHLIYKNDFLREIQTFLKLLHKDASEINKSKIKELNFKISQNIQSSREAKIVEEKIKEINSGFFFKLSEAFPDLTENDKNLCALVRMNLSSKEIASINNISERSVITARYRYSTSMGFFI